MNLQTELHLARARFLSRRWFFRECGVGLAGIAAHALLAKDGFAAPADATETKIGPLAPRPSHFPPKVKRVIYMFNAGGPSQLELYDPKPELAKRNGQLPPADLLKGYRAAFINPNSALLGPKYKFQPFGKCGTELSEVLPSIGEIADEVERDLSVSYVPGATTEASRALARGADALGWRTGEIPRWMAYPEQGDALSGKRQSMTVTYLPNDEVAAIRARLDHPVIDNDGHIIEFLPLVRDIIVELAGESVVLARTDPASLVFHPITKGSVTVRSTYRPGLPNTVVMPKWRKRSNVASRTLTGAALSERSPGALPFIAPLDCIGTAPLPSDLPCVL